LSRRPPLTVNGWMRWALIAPLLDGGIESVLEIGVGQGALGFRLAERYRYLGLELDERALAVARRRFERAGLGELVQGDLDTLPPDERFDLIVATEVLEHYEDDVGALALWRTRLAARGALLLSVPAFPERFGPWDVKAGHFRRYERAWLAAALQAAGFEAVAIRTYGFPLGNLLEAARDAVARRQPADASMSERTAASGRLLQPSERAGWLTASAGTLGGMLQRPFTEGRHGVGFVALARARD
jgi:SAM-dependent methyltransferase